MPSLKSLRTRIASVKATQKITKAMQMVAASKLRRAQAAAEAARPFAEKMDAVLQNIASGMAGSGTAPKLLTGTGSDKVHLLIVATGERQGEAEIVHQRRLAGREIEAPMIDGDRLVVGTLQIEGDTQKIARLDVARPLADPRGAAVLVGRCLAVFSG